MIVHCTGCQARFRVADERVGARGARIRCSRCQTLFTIGPAGAPAPTPAPSSLSARAAGPRDVPEVELETPAPAPPPATDDDPFAGFRLDAGPPFGPPRAGSDLSSDPFGAGDPFGGAPLDLATEPGPGSGWPAPDPLEAGGTAQVAPLAAGDAHRAEPAWAGAPDGAGALGRGGAERLDRAAPAGGSAWMDDPFAAALSPRSERSSLSERSLPLTDLADLVGEAPRPPAVPPPLPRPRGAPSFPGEPGLDLEGPDLALEEPSTPPSPPVRGADDDPLGGFPFTAPREAEVAGPSELGALAAAEEEPLALATEAAPALPEMWRTGPVHLPEPEEPAATTAPAVAAAPADPAAASVRRGAFRAVAVNALSLAALLVVALGFRLLWRGEGAADAATRPAALLRALGIGGRPAAALDTAGVTSGRYPRADGAPLLLVRGEVISRAAGPIARVRVDVEVVRGGRVIAARSALAGAVPTPEELFAVKDAAGLDALSAAVARRAQTVGPNAPVPFLVAFADVPEDLTGASLRVVATGER